MPNVSLGADPGGEGQALGQVQTGVVSAIQVVPVAVKGRCIAKRSGNIGHIALLGSVIFITGRVVGMAVETVKGAEVGLVKQIGDLFFAERPVIDPDLID